MASCSNADHSIKVKGSDTEVNLSVSLAEAFHKHNKNILVSVSGGGSGLGIAALLNGNADLANSSRQIKEGELQLFKNSNLQIDSFIFAVDAVAFVVGDNMPIDSVSIDELSKILSGSEKDWQFLTKTAMPINIYGRQSNSGTYEYVKQKLKIQFSPYAKQMNGNAQILEASSNSASLASPSLKKSKTTCTSSKADPAAANSANNFCKNRMFFSVASASFGEFQKSGSCRFRFSSSSSMAFEATSK